MQEIRLARVPGQRPEPADFTVSQGDQPAAVGPGQVRVRSLLIGLNVGLRHRLGTGRATALGPALDLEDVPRSDAVGGDHVRAALSVMRDRGRVVALGRAGDLDHEPVLHDTSQLISRRLSLTGCAVTDHEDQRPDLVQMITDIEASQHRRLKPAATVRLGLEALPGMFCDLLAGRIIGRGVVDLAPTEHPPGES